MGPPSRPSASGWQSIFSRALAAHRAGDLAAARALCREAAEQGDDPAPPRLLALLLAEAGEHEAALGWVRRALALDPGSALSHAALGRVRSAAGAWSEAAGAFRVALGRDAELVAAHEGLGHALLADGQPIAACENFAAALRRRPSVETRRAYAAALMRAASVARAESAVAAFPGVGELRHALGQMLFRAGRPADSARVLAAAAALLAEDAAIRHDLGTALHEAGRPADAAAAYAEALARDPGRVETWHNLGSSRQAMGDMEGALAAYGRAHALDPASFPRIAQELAAGGVGRVWLRAENLRRALREN